MDIKKDGEETCIVATSFDSAQVEVLQELLSRVGISSGVSSETSEAGEEFSIRVPSAKMDRAAEIVEQFEEHQKRGIPSTPVCRTCNSVNITQKHEHGIFFDHTLLVCNDCGAVHDPPTDPTRSVAGE